MKRRVLATLIGIGMLAGCAKASPMSAMATPPQQTASSMSIQNCHRGARMFAGLDLTQEQKDKIKAIVKKARAAKGEDKKVIEGLLTAPTVDRDALTAAINAKLAKHDEHIDSKVAMLVEIRDVLTPEQRTKAAEKLTAKAKKAGSHADDQKHHAKMLAKIADKLSMTDEQKAKFQAVIDAFGKDSEARHARHAAKKAALAAFMTSGDADALKTALKANKPDVPVAAIVDALASLDQGQRQKLAEIKQKMMKRHHHQETAEAQEQSDEQVAAADEAKDEAKPAEEPSQVESGDGQEPRDDED